ncbi:MAG: Holliday junction DNA helicase RuvB C-terminal domain-containing protein [Vicinamibacterales bacterium]
MKVPLQKFTLDRRDHARGSADVTAARAVRDRASAGVLRRQPDMDEIVRRSARILDVPIADEAAARDRRAARAARRASPTVCCGASATSRRFERTGRITLRCRPGGAEAARGRRPMVSTRVDRKLLRTIIEKFGGGPVGVNSIAAAISEERDAIEDIYEPYLIQTGFLDCTPRGRVATARAYEYFGLKAPGRDSRLW